MPFPLLSLARALALFTVAAVSSAPAADITLTATGISVPFYDAAGNLTHRMEARSGSVVGAEQQLQEVEVVYYSPKDPRQVVQRLLAAEATWDNQKEILKGPGSIEVTTDENRLAGEGFDFALATSRLCILRNFSMSNHEVLLTSDRADIELVVDRRGDEVKVRDVKRCEAVGNLHVTVQSTARRKYLFDEAWSRLAIYDGATQIITFPETIRYVSQGKKAQAKSMNLELGARAGSGMGAGVGVREKK